MTPNPDHPGREPVMESWNSTLHDFVSEADNIIQPAHDIVEQLKEYWERQRARGRKQPPPENGEGPG